MFGTLKHALPALYPPTLKRINMSRGNSWIRKLAVVAVVLLSAPAHSAGSDIRYFGTLGEAVAACNSDEVPWNTGCIPNSPSYASWCNTLSQGTPGPNLSSYSRVLQLYLPTPPHQRCLTPASTTYVVYTWPKTACPSGTGLVGPTGHDCLTPAVIQQSADSKKQLGRGVGEGDACALYGNPCDTSTGNKLQIETDFAGGDGIPSFVRTYNSLDFTNSARFGAGWMHNQMRFLEFGHGTPSTITVVRGDGQREAFTSAGSEIWTGQADSRRRVTRTSLGYKIEHPTGASEFYWPDGRLQTATDRFGRVTSYTYVAGVLASVTGPYGHKITFTGRSNGYSVMFPSGWSAGAATVFHYDIDGRLIAETDATGATLREYVWDDDGRPLAQIAAGVVTYLHPDHLGTPRFGTDAGRAVVWQWASDAFGTTSPTGAVTVNLRYPGQYFDAETGLHYNWHRTYDPGSGRYLESDPIGISLASSRPYSEGSVAIARTNSGLSLHILGMPRTSIHMSLGSIIIALD